jgi:hypothetical protein
MAGPRLRSSMLSVCALAAIAVTAGFTASVHAADTAAPQTAHAPRTLTVISSGRLPGFALADIPAYLSREMAEATLDDWLFEPIAADFSPPADRVEWSFRVDGDKGAADPPISDNRRFVPRRLLVAEVRLYLNGQYQTVTSAQVDIYGGVRDEELAAFVRRLSQSLLGSAGAYHAIEFRQKPAPAPSR